jgi:Glycosyltransferase family 87
MVTMRRQAMLWLLTAALGLLALGYNGAGCYYLLFGTSTETSYPIDLRLRWIEEHLFVRGLDPQVLGHPDPQLPPSHAPMKGLGGSYPPWAYTTGVLLVPPLDWPATRIYYLILNLASLALIGAWALRLGAGAAASARALCVAAILAMFPLAICISYGQYGVPITACLVAVLISLEAGWDTCAGLLLGVALVKPQLSGLFALALLLRRRYRAVAWAALYLAAASCCAWAVTGSDPLAMLRRTSREAAQFSFLSHNPLVPPLAARYGFEATTLLLGAAGVLACTVLVASLRADDRRGLARAFAICSILTMYWSYRRHYDCVLMAFPMACLASAGVGARNNAMLAIFLLFGASLWLPIRHAQWAWPPVQIAHALIWSLALIVLIWAAARQPASPAPGRKLSLHPG